MTDEIRNIDGYPCRPIRHHCKFCRKPITLWIAIDYGGDPYKLMDKASCNRCADMRTNRRSLEEQMATQFNNLCLLKSSKTKKPDILAKARDNVETLTRQYASLIAKWNNLEGMAWEPSIVDTIMDNPHDWPDVIRRMWKMVRA